MKVLLLWEAWVDFVGVENITKPATKFYVIEDISDDDLDKLYKASNKYVNLKMFSIMSSQRIDRHDDELRYVYEIGSFVGSNNRILVAGGYGKWEKYQIFNYSDLMGLIDGIDDVFSCGYII